MPLKDELDALFGPAEYFSEEGDGSFAIPRRPQIGALPGPEDLATGTTDELQPDPLKDVTDRFSNRTVRAKKGSMDRTRVLGAGVADLGEMVVGAGEYVARQNKFLRPDVAPALESVRGGIKEIREGILSGVSPEYLDMIGREMLTLDPEKTIWQGGPLEVADAVYGKFVRSIPSTLAVMLPAGRMFKVANTRGALAYLGASEGGLSVGAIQNNIADEIAGMTNDELLQESEAYRRIYDGVGGNEELARQEFTAEAQGAAPLIGGLGVASISLATGRLLKPIFTEGGLGLGRRASQGFLAEFPQEGSQGATEQFVQNFAAQIYDEGRNLSEGVAEAFVQEGTIGGLTGAGVAGAFGERPQRPLPPPAEGEGGQLNIPGMGTQIPNPEPEQGIPDPYDPAEVGRRNQQLDLQGGLDLDPRSGRDLSQSTEAVMVPPSADSPTGVPDQGVLPMTLRERGRPVLQENPRGPRLPDTLDQPTAEPEVDIQAQLDDMKGAGGRSAVYLSPEQRNTNMKLPKGAVVIPNFDGKGGVIIAKNQEAAQYARQRRAEGGSMQAIIGELTLAGTGKPNVRSGFAVQLLDENGAVARESLRGTRTEANTLAKAWGADGETRVLSGEEALARRSDLLEREQIDLSQDQEAVARRNEQLPLGDDTPAVMPPYVSPSEKASESVRKVLPFEERTQAIELTKNVASEKQAAERLSENANVAADKEERRRIGGFYAPSEMEFADKFQEQEYSQAWDDLVTSELTLEMSNQKAAKTKAEKTKAASLRRLATARTVGKPKRKTQRSERLAVAAAAVDKSTARTRLKNVDRNQENLDLGELNPAELTPERIDDLADVELTYQNWEGETVTQKVKPSKLEAAKDKARLTYHTAARKDGVADAKDPTFKEKILETQELNVAFEQAIRSYVDHQAQYEFTADREPGAPLTPEQVSGNNRILEREYRAQYDTPGKKTKLIRRESANTARRQSEQRAVRATEVTVKAKEGTLKAEKKRSTEALTVDKRATEESVSQRLKRAEKVKNAKSRLRAAISKTNSFMNRFDTGGEYGTFVAEQTNVDGSMTKEARDFIYARDYLVGIKQWADSIIAADNASNDYADMANGISQLLERLQQKTMSPDRFATEWAALARSNEFEYLKEVPTKFKESMGERYTKINKKNRERHNANERTRLLRDKWKSDKIFNEIVEPIFRKFSEATLVNASDPARNAYYNPTEFEIENLRFALRSYRKMGLKYDVNEFYNPIKAQLEYYGFNFDEAGDLIVEKFSPSDNLLGSGFIAKHGESKKAADAGTSKQQTAGGFIVDPPIKVPDTLADRKHQDLVDNKQAVLEIRGANALLDRLQETVAPSKITINGIKRQEQRYIRGLRKLGVWSDTSPGMGRISFRGYQTKTYRLVGPRLDGRVMTKAEAKAAIARMKRTPIPRELAGVDKLLSDPKIDVTIKGFIDENSIELFLDATKAEQYDADYMDAASAIGDMLLGKNGVNALDALTEIMKSAPPDSFYYQLSDKLSTLGLTDIEVAYGSDSDFAKGELGKFRPRDNIVLLNRDALNDVAARGDRVFGARVMHVLTHEITHGATHQAIKKNPRLKEYMMNLRTAARDEWMRRNRGVVGGPKPTIPYGLQSLSGSKVVPIDEFVVEAFSNYEFQQFLKSVKVDQETLWQKITKFVRDLLGISEDVPESIFDAVMMAEDVLFEDAGVAGDRNSEDFWLESYDTPMRNIANTVWSKVKQHSSIVQRVKDTAGASLRNLMTMEQFREAYGKYFEGALDRYVEAFNKRNAKASQYMHVPENLSRTWTKLFESSPEDATAISQIGSQATLQEIAADKPADDEANGHLSESMKEVHADLHAQYNAMSPEAKKLYADLQKYYQDSVKRESTYLLQSALRGILTKGSGINLSLDEFNEKFSYDALAAIDSRENLSAMLEDYIPEEGRRDMLDTLYKMSYVPQRRRGNYFPLMRYGDEVVYAEKQWEDEIFEDRKEAMGVRSERSKSDPTLDVQAFQKDGKWVVRTFEREFVMAESVTEVEKKRAELVERYGEENVFDPQKRASQKTDEAISSNAALNSIIKTLEGNTAAQAAIKNFYLRSLSEASFRKHEVKRKNRRGVDYDSQHRNLATYAKQASYYTSQLEFGWQMSEAVKEMELLHKRRKAGPGEIDTRTLSQVTEHLKSRDQMSADLPDVQKLVRSGVEYTHFFMLTSPSYWAINATQPWVVTAPTIAARHGWGQTIAAMGQIQKLVKSPLISQARKTKAGFGAVGKGKKSMREDAFDVVTQLEEHIRQNAPAKADEYIKLLDDLRDLHIIDINVFTEMRDVAAGKSQGIKDQVIDASRIMAHLTEVNNRVLVALSAYQLERNAGKSIEEATKYAGDMVSQTQFNYSSTNKPPLFQPGGPLGGVAPLMFQFMQWPQHMYAHLIRNYRGMVDAGVMNKSEARSALLGLLSTHAAVGGLVGMTLQPIKWAFGLVMMAFGDDDEPYTFANAVSGRSFDRKLAEITADLFGTTASTVISKGVPAALGVDLSTRMSMGTLYFVDMRGEDAQGVLGSLMLSFGGATLNQAVNMGRGMAKIADGDILKGIESLTPKITRDAIRAVRYYNEGLVNNAGDTVIPASEMSPGELVAQFLGLAPTDISNFYSAQNAIKDAEGYALDRKSELLRSFRMADDAADRRQAMRAIQEFNRSFPAERITRSSLLSNRKTQREREARYRRYGANIDEKKARFYEGYGSPYRDE